MVYRVLVCLLLIQVSQPTLAQEKSSIYIKVGQARVKKSLLALPPFQYHGSPGVSGKSSGIGRTLFHTVLNDLDVSSYFRFIGQNAFLEDTSKVGIKPYPGDPKGFHFDKWRSIGTEFLVRAAYKLVKGQLTFQAYAYYVPKAELILGKEYAGSIKDARKMAHMFSNDLMQALTGKKGMFLSQIVVASDRAGRGWREVYVMDWDGNNAKKVTSHRSVAVSPNWAPDGKSVVYTAYAYHRRTKTRNADLFSYDLYKGKRYLLSGRKGINSGAAYHPNGEYVYLTLSQGGNPDIFRIPSGGGKRVRVTRGPHGAMNVEPSVSPDGKKIAFSSDRSGKPMIYVMNIDGSNIRRVTFAGRYNSSPAWSPDSKKLAFAGYDKGHYDIFIMNSSGTQMKRLTTARKANGKYADNEDPSFSPDGRHLIFTSNRSGKNQIYIVNVDGTNERRVTVDQHNYFKAKWGWHTPE